MAKVALLIGVSDYQISGSNQGFTDLPSAKLDVEGMKRILDNPELAAFDQVTPLLNPRFDRMSWEIETFLGSRQKADLVLLYFSGHGAKHEKTRKLYFAAQGTEKNDKDQLITSTAVSAATVRDWLSECQATKKIMILDCCFSGAIDPNAKGDDTLEALEASLSAVKGSVILTSSSSTEISYGDATQMSFYTRHFVRGIETGEADPKSNGFLSIDELHKYVSEKIRLEDLKMNPKVFVLQEEGFYTTQLIKVPIADPRQAYRKKVEALIKDGYAKNGKFSQYTQDVLEYERSQINQSSKEQLLLDDASAIESDLLRPIKQRLDNLEKYRKAFRDNLESSTLDQNRKDLKLWQTRSLKLEDTDVADIEQEEQQRQEAEQERLGQEAEQQRAKEQEKQGEHQTKLQQYEREFRKAIEAGYPIDSSVRDGLNQFQQSLQLSDEDVTRIEAPLLVPKEEAYQQRLAEEKRRKEAEHQLELEKQQKLEQQRQEQFKQETAAKQKRAEEQESQQREAEQLKQKQAEATRLRPEELEKQRELKQRLLLKLRPEELEKQRELKRQLLLKKAQKTPNIGELPSEKGIDYTKLRDLLKQQDWQAADKETADRMCEAMKRQREGYLRFKDAQNFPCADLRTIDQLWVRHSKGKFGFSVQKKIWQSCGSPTEYGKKWEKFGELVGWKDPTGWVGSFSWYLYSKYRFTLEASHGHLPSMIEIVNGRADGSTFDGWGVNVRMCVDLFSRGDL